MNSDMNIIERSRAELQLVLGDVERWLGAISSLSASIDLGLPSTAGRDLEAVGRLRTRAASSLINVALLGSFSSGKSFLIGGLQGGMKLTRVPSDDGEASDKFIGLLPSAPTPTTACPASVVPVVSSSQVDASGRGFLRVRFSDIDQWEDIGASAPPPVVAAYAMGDSDVIRSRRDEHRNRSVAEIEILISEFLLPAKLYDLPGHGSPDPIYDQIIRDAVEDADCFIYVSMASASLSDADLDLIRFLYRHHVNSGKRVVWVVTAIDRTMELGLDDRPAWTATVARNNSYLGDNFTLPDGRPDMGFIGEGFIPVSPALEARGKFLIDEGDRVAGRRLLAESRMDILRQTLSNMIRTDTGPRHVAAIASECRALLFAYQRALSERLETERLPVDRLVSQKRDLRDRLRDLQIAFDATGARLGAILDRRINNARQAFNGLAPHLRERLEGEILAADLRKPGTVNQIEVHRTRIIRDWMTSPTGPLDIWERELEAFTGDVLTEVRTAVLASQPLGDLRSSQIIDIDELTAPKSQRSQSDTQDVVQRAAAVVGALTPFGAGVAAALGILAGPFLLIPAGVTAAAVLAYTGITLRKRRATSLDLLRQEWIAELGEIASEIERLFVAAASLAGSEIIGRAVAILADRRDQLTHSLLVVQERMEQSETTIRQDLIARLKPICRDGDELLARLTQLSHVVHA
jgi:ElaB/YqjD/DUF883 family membrane-anchored ribosome-binding protein